MADLQSILARVKTALASGATSPPHADPRGATQAFEANGHQLHLVDQFAKELEAVSGRTLGPVLPEELADRIVAIAHERGIKSIAMGEGVVLDFNDTAQALQGAGLTIIRTGRVDSSTRAALRDQLAQVDGGLAEADYGIAATGTLAVLSGESRPSALTLLPPASIVVLRLDRMQPDLASALAAIGPAALENHRLTLITGPSRTADIEKRIVMGVHGPKSLDVIVVRARQ
jgi:L-lactate dehydrogenase complex protein LldG